MERLFRLGHEPALTLGNTKNIDILVRTRSEQLRTISVKAVQGGGKWPVGRRDLSNERDLVFVFLLYRSFGNVTTDPDVWIMPAVDVETRKQGWIDGSAIYYAHKELVVSDLGNYRDAWHYVA